MVMLAHGVNAGLNGRRVAAIPYVEVYEFHYRSAMTTVQRQAFQTCPGRDDNRLSALRVSTMQGTASSNAW